MGLYDKLICKYPLPVDGANDLDYQTKDTPSQYLDWYVIDENGKLFEQQYDVVDKSDPNAEGLMRLRGCMARENERFVPCDYTGAINFYSFWDDLNNKGWIEFCGLFDHGQMLKVEVVENRPIEA